MLKAQDYEKTSLQEDQRLEVLMPYAMVGKTVNSNKINTVLVVKRLHSYGAPKAEKPCNRCIQQF